MAPSVCRTCLQEGSLISLYTEHEQISLLFSKILDYCASIQAEMGDGLPSEICTNCIDLLVTFYNFKKSVIENDQKLRQNLIKMEEQVKLVDATNDQEDSEEDLPAAVLIPKVEIKAELDDDPCNADKPEDSTDKPSKKTQCPICGKYLVSLVRHMKIHTEDKRFQCDTCGKKFRLLHCLKTHTRTHTGERPLKCTICPKSFSQYATLYTHLRTHSGERPHVCSTCGKSYTQLAALNHHLRKHTGETPYKCKVCSKEFAHSGNLKMHMRFHNNDRPYSCDVCAMTFVAASHLSTHVKTHLKKKKVYSKEERPFACSVCMKRYVDDGLLAKHMKRHRLV